MLRSRRPTDPVPFYLYRKEDVSGVSGTGVVAVGVVLPSGKAVLEWCSRWPTVTLFHSVDQILRIHGHGGNTEVRFGPVPAADAEPIWVVPPEQPPAAARFRLPLTSRTVPLSPVPLWAAARIRLFRAGGDRRPVRPGRSRGRPLRESAESWPRRFWREAAHWFPWPGREAAPKREDHPRRM